MTIEEPDDVATTVRIMLAAARLAPSSEEFDVIVEAYPSFRAAIESLYVVPEVRYEAPAVILDADPVFADWAS